MSHVKIYLIDPHGRRLRAQSLLWSHLMSRNEIGDQNGKLTCIEKCIHLKVLIKEDKA